MKDIFNVNDFQSLNLEGLKVIVSFEEEVNYKEVRFEGVATIDYSEFKEVYNENLEEALILGENYILELEGYVEKENEEFKVLGYKLNNDTKKIELILE